MKKRNTPAQRSITPQTLSVISRFLGLRVNEEAVTPGSVERGGCPERDQAITSSRFCSFRAGQVRAIWIFPVGLRQIVQGA